MINPIKTYNVVDKEYNERIKKAKATNLAPEKPEEFFVPMQLVRDFYLNVLDLEDLLPENITNCRNRIDQSIVKLNYIPDEEASAIDVCPYCGNKMYIATGDQLEHIQFSCLNCGASSPAVSFKTSMIDENKVKNEIKTALLTTYNTSKEKEDLENVERYPD